MTFRADVHCHTFFSDGTDSPSELLHLAKKVGLQGVSITDHDTIAAYTPDLRTLAGELGVALLTGVEISTEWRDRTVHVLGYGFSLEKMSPFVGEVLERRKKRNRAILQRLEKMGIVLEEKELASSAHFVVGRPHIAQLLVQKGYVKEEREAFSRYLQEGAPAYVAGLQMTPKEAIFAIRDAGGKAVLAHPHFWEEGPFLTEVLSFPFQGIECFYGNFPRDAVQKWERIAKEKGWIATGGSDYHGKYRPSISLGASWIEESTWEQLRSHG